MKNRVYNKLVRDRIPEIIEADGKNLHHRDTVGYAISGDAGRQVE